MDITDLAKARWPSHPTIDPAGQRIVFTLTRIDTDADDYHSDLWAVDTSGETEPRRWSNGPHDSAPLFSPDGRWLAFLREDADKHAQLHVMAADGGEAREVSRHPLGVAQFAWSPDSERIAYLARVPEEGRYGTAEGVTPDKEPPRRITTLKYRLDGVGFTFDRPRHLFVVDALDEDAEPSQLTEGEFDHLALAWHPEGAQIAFVSARHDSRDTDMARDVHIISAAGGPVRTVTDASLPIQGRLAYTPDGDDLLFAAQGGLDAVGRTLGLFSVPANGDAPPRRLSDEEDIDLGGLAAAERFPLLPDPDGVTSLALRRGAAELVRLPLDGMSAQPPDGTSAQPPDGTSARTPGSSAHTLVGGRVQVLGYDRAGDTFGTLAVVVADDTSAGEVAVVRNGDTKVLTNVGAGLASSADLRPMQEVHATAPDGYPVHGWVVKPSGPGPFPTVLCIHGGPHHQFGYALFDEAQVYAGAGYAVVLGNPRGSAGYGDAHGRAVIGDFGGVDQADLIALLDASLDDPDLDDERVGVMGGSYGGFMSAWMIAHSDRFRTAVVERGFLAPDSFIGSSDIGSFFVDMYLGTDPGRQAAQSPLAKADQIRTPTLVIHSEQDWRCPVEQGQRLYVALKRAGVDCELLLFPGEGHELSRSGLPSHRAARFEAILDWLDRYL